MLAQPYFHEYARVNTSYINGARVTVKELCWYFEKILPVVTPEVRNFEEFFLLTVPIVVPLRISRTATDENASSNDIAFPILAESQELHDKNVNVVSKHRCVLIISFIMRCMFTGKASNFTTQSTDQLLVFYDPQTSNFSALITVMHNKRDGVSNHQRVDCCTTVCSDVDQRKHLSSASLAFFRGFTGDQWIPRTMSQWCGKCFHLMTSWYFVHDDVIKWKHFPRNWPLVRGIHRSPVNSQHKGQWRGALKFSLICVWINDWVNNREGGDLRRYRAHYDVIVRRRGEVTMTVIDSDCTMMLKWLPWDIIVMGVCFGNVLWSPWLPLKRVWHPVHGVSCNSGRVLTAGDVVMMTSWHGNTFRMTGPLWGESTGNQWIPITKGQ